MPFIWALRNDAREIDKTSVNGLSGQAQLYENIARQLALVQSREAERKGI